MLLDVIDLSRLKAIGDTAFAMADGKEIRIAGSPIRIKFRPRDGYRDLENLRNRLEARNMCVDELFKEEMLFTYCYGKPQQGIFAYLKPGAYKEDVLSGLSDTLKKVVAAKYFT